MTVTAAAGSKISVVAGAPGSHDAAGFAAQTHIQIKGVTGLPEMGDDYGWVEAQPMDEPICGANTAIQVTDLSYPYIVLSADPGQVIAVAGNGGGIHSFKIDWEGGDVTYFTGHINGITDGASDATQARTGTVTIKKVGVTVYA